MYTNIAPISTLIASLLEHKAHTLPCFPSKIFFFLIAFYDSCFGQLRFSIYCQVPCVSKFWHSQLNLRESVWGKSHCLYNQGKSSSTFSTDRVKQNARNWNWLGWNNIIKIGFWNGLERHRASMRKGKAWSGFHFHLKADEPWRIGPF